MIELEKTYLIKNIPDGLLNSNSKEIIDVYIPALSEHPSLRIRKNGDRYEMTKKEPVKEGDASHQEEQTITLTEIEFEALKQIPGKKARKIRYYFEYEGRVAEVDVFKGALEGLVLVDFEFENMEEKDAFEMPEFCLVDVTQEKFLAGGMLCGKSYEDISENLERLGYKKLSI
jgi:CYTH domain-containing protein